MAIHIFCTACKISYGLDVKKCSKCGAVFGRDKKYRVCVSVKGRRVTRVVDNLTLAREAETTIKTDLLRGEFETHSEKKSKQAPTLDEIWEKYLPWAKEHKKTWDDDQYHYHRHIKPRFGKKRLDTITPFDIETMKIELNQETNKNGKPFARQTIKHHLSLLRKLFAIAVTWGLYNGENPMDQVGMPKVNNQKTEYMTDEETERLLRVLEEWPCRESAAIVRFALFTGLRRGELFKLRWSDIDFDRNLLTLRYPKGGTDQTIPVSDTALEILKARQRTSSYVFPGKNGEQRTDFKGPWRRIRKAAGLPEDFRFHGLRHNFASQLVSNGVDLAIVGKLLTHKDLTTTQRYAHLKPDIVREAAQKSAEWIKPGQDG